VGKAVLQTASTQPEQVLEAVSQPLLMSESQLEFPAAQFSAQVPWSQNTSAELAAVVQFVPHWPQLLGLIAKLTCSACKTQRSTTVNVAA
jgi:hypothetical protein